MVESPMEQHCLCADNMCGIHVIVPCFILTVCRQSDWSNDNNVVVVRSFGTLEHSFIDSLDNHSTASGPAWSRRDNNNNYTSFRHSIQKRNSVQGYFRIQSS